MNDTLIFEQLPNEIFQELFEYFDSYELYRTFSQLNSRFNSLVTNFNHLQIILYSPEEIDYFVNRYFLPTTTTLIIDHVKNFYDPLNLTLLSHIRCLILCQPTREQWNSIQPSQFPCLERLHLINSKFIYRTEQLCGLIFSNAFPYLHSCSLPHISYEMNSQWTCSQNLQSLHVKIWDIRVYLQILRTCPNLIRLKIEISGGDHRATSSVCDSNLKHSALRYLAWHSSSPINCDLIDSILSVVSGLNRLLLHANHPQASQISVHTLATILESRTPNLTRINIDITVPESFCDEEQKQTINRLFKSCRIQHGLHRVARLRVRGAV